MKQLSKRRNLGIILTLDDVNKLQGALKTSRKYYVVRQ